MQASIGPNTIGSSHSACVEGSALVSDPATHVSGPTPDSSGRLSAPEQSSNTESTSRRLDYLGRQWKTAGFQSRLPIYSPSLGEVEPLSNMIRHGVSGVIGVVNK